MNLLRLIHTVRHLRARQIVGQVSHRVRRLIEDPAVVRSWNAPAFPRCRWKPIQPFLPPSPGANSANAITSGSLTFLNHSHRCGFPPDWRADGLPKLWRYNLHYHDFLWLLHPVHALSVAENWIDHHLPQRGAEGWESYPTSLRLMNWVMFFDEHTLARLWPSVFQQSKWLARHLETHLLGNHLLENAAALAMVGSCFGGKHAARWFDVGLKLLREQLDEQILPDGGHFERSPMYQSRVVYVLANLKNTGNEKLRDLISDPLDRATRALTLMCHPDGEIALLNDSALGVYPVPSISAPVGNFELPDTGYFGARTNDGTYIICDAGPIGPDYLPGHGHGDIFSFELSLRGHRVIVDGGVHDYEIGAMREYCRSTRAHNTVELLGADQCEFWGAFRVAKRGRVRGISFLPTPDGFQLTAEHDGYVQLRKNLRHRRSFLWRHAGEVVISDSVAANLESGNEFVSRLHLHPNCEVISAAGRCVHVRYPAGQFSIDFTSDGNVRTERSYFCPEFGRRIDNTVVVFSPSEAPRADSEITVRIAQHA